LCDGAPVGGHANEPEESRGNELDERRAVGDARQRPGRELDAKGTFDEAVNDICGQVSQEALSDRARQQFVQFRGF
jgi:hypothetical protein